MLSSIKPVRRVPFRSYYQTSKPTWDKKLSDQKSDETSCRFTASTIVSSNANTYSTIDM